MSAFMGIAAVLCRGFFVLCCMCGDLGMAGRSVVLMWFAMRVEWVVTYWVVCGCPAGLRKVFEREEQSTIPVFIRFG